MNNSEWEVFKKEVKPIKKSGTIKKRPKKVGINKQNSEQITNRKTFDHIDLEDNPLRVSHVDKNLIKRIKNGKINISSILDLHSFTIEESKLQVLEFIKKNFRLGNRLSLIITGKGKRLSVSDGWRGDGKLKKIVPVWLSSSYLSNYVLWFDKATPEKGGEGALFVYLKKIKE